MCWVGYSWSGLNSKIGVPGAAGVHYEPRFGEDHERWAQYFIDWDQRYRSRYLSASFK